MTQTKSVEQLLEEMGISQEDYERQCKLELDGFEAGRQRYMDQYEATLSDPNKDNTLLKPESQLLRHYMDKVSTGVTASILGARRGGSSKVKAIRDALKPLGAQRMAYLALRFALNVSYGSLTDCCVKMGSQVKHDLEYFWFQELAPGYLRKVERNLTSSHVAHRHNVLRHAAKKVELVEEDGVTRVKGIPSADWDTEDQFLIGKRLLEVVTETTPLLKVSAISQRKNVSREKYGYLTIKSMILEQTDTCRELLNKLHNKLSEVSPITYPAVIPPRPWAGIRGGGYWTQYRQMGHICKLLRSRQAAVHANAAAEGVERVCSVLNMIQATPYRINQRVLEVMEEARLSGLGGLPSPDQDRVEVEGTYPLEEECPWSDEEVRRMKKSGDPRWMQWNQRRSKAWDIWYRDQSKRSALLWKLNIARKFKAEPELYFFWNMDYRGRVYCIQPYINPQQDDSGKALIEFAEGKPLGAEGAYWLCVHGANEFGYDKATLDERWRWVEDHAGDILDSAVNPLDGRRFWCEAENPFQFLAFCMEYKGLMEQGYDYVSHLPCQVDGTCSGLQHYSALLRDAVGGRAVNLIPQDHKADVYQEVANVVLSLLNEEGGDDQEYAKAWLELGVDRKTVKRNVMTFCYGATRPGFSQQLIDDIDEKPAGVDAFKACHYLGGINWNAVEMTLVKSVEAMGFLQKLAHFMAKNGMDIQWVTPIGLRVTQDYLKTSTKQINTWWGGVRLQPRLSKDTVKKNPVGSRNGIAPNFIHSLDASHLMLTTERCWAKGIRSFSYIHDSFGTHAADMAVLNMELREAFIEMYSKDLLSKFVEDVAARVPGELRSEFDELVETHRPELGSLNLNGVGESLYFFS